MYTKLFYKLFYYQCRACTTFGVCSISFDQKTSTCFITPKAKNRLLRISIVWTVATIYMWCRTLQVALDQGTKNPNFHISYILSLIGSMITVGLVVQYWRQHDLVHVLNLGLKHVVTFQRLWMPTYNPEKEMASRLVDMFLIFGLSLVAVVPWTGPLCVLIFPDLPIFVYTLFPPSEWGVGFVRVIFCVDVVVTLFGGFIVIICLLQLVGISAMFYFPYLRVIMEELNVTNTTRHKAIRALRDVHNLPRQYTCFRLIFEELLDITGWIILFLQSIVGHFCLFCNFATIKHWKSMGWYSASILGVWSILLQLTWGTFLQLGGRIETAGKEAVQSWRRLDTKTKHDGKLMAKIRKSIRPLVIGKEGLFTLKRKSVLKFFRGIMKGTFRALLTIGR